MQYMRTIATTVAAGFLLAACGSNDTTEPAPEYDDLTAADVTIELQITEQQFLVVWNVAWTAEPTIAEDVVLEPGTGWVVTYETTAPEMPTFTGELYSFTIEVGPDGEVWVDDIALSVDEHPINTHPDNLVVEIIDVIEQ